MDIMKDLSLTNYAAVAILEHMGINPSQKQIDTIESLVEMLSYPLEIDSDTIKECVGDDKLAYHFLIIKVKELHKNLWCACCRR